MTTTIRYISALSVTGGNGSTTGIAGANRAWTMAEALASISGGVEYRVLNNGTYNITSTITSTGNSSFLLPARIIGYDANTLEPLNVRLNPNGSYNTSGLPLINLSNTVSVGSSTSQYVMFANLVVSGTANTTIFNFNGQCNIFDNVHVHNYTGVNSSSLAAFGVGFRGQATNCTAIVSSQGGYAFSLASTEAQLNNCLSFGSGIGAGLNNNSTVTNCLFLTPRGVLIAASSQGVGMVRHCTFASNTGYCIAVRNDINMTGRVNINECLFMNGRRVITQADGNGVEQNPTGVRPVHIFNNHFENTPLGTGVDTQFVFNNTTSSGSVMFVGTGTNDFRYVIDASGVGNRRFFNNNVGAMGTYVPLYRTRVY
jgi:hypothetical protein